MNQRTDQFDRASDRRLALGFALSVLVHVMAVVLLIAAPVVSDAATRELERPEVDEPEPDDDEIRLGDPDSRVTSFTWIGHDEYQEQYSPVPSQVDQAQLTTSPRAPVPVTTPMSQTSPRPEPVPPAPTESLAGGDVRESSEAQDKTSEALEQVLATLEQPPVDLPADIPVDTAPSEQASEAAAPAPSTQPVEGEGDAPETVRLSPMSGTPEDDDGDLADRSSSFSATMKRDEFQQGKPLSGHGLYVETVRPRANMYSQVTRALRSPKSPLFRINFLADGTVDYVEVVESSGVRDVDRPLLDLLYRWKARGPQLDVLQGGRSDETISVEIRILFGRQ